jgi:ATP synthase protein I
MFVTPPRSPRELHVRRAGGAYQGAFEAVFAILIGVGFGYWADASFETSPWGLLLGLVLGFSAFVLRLVRLAREMQALADEEKRTAGER